MSITPERTKLKNGLIVLTARMPGAYSATVSVMAGVGSRYEDYDVNGGVSHFLEHLLFKGTPTRPSTKIISEQIDAVGGWSNAYTSNEMTNYYTKVPYQHVNLALEIQADMIRNSILDPEEIDRERGVVLEEMNVYQDDPASYVHRLTPSLLWPDHPLAREVLGSEAVIRTIQREAIESYLKHHYEPNNLVVVVAGRVDHDKIVAQCEALFGDMKPTQRAKALPVTKELSSTTKNVLIKDTAQAHLVVSTTAYPFLHPNVPAARLATTILGRGLSSRLFMNVRERKGLAYSINAGQESYVDTGEFEVYAGVNLEKQADAIAAIIEELQLIGREPVGEDELNKAKNQIRGGLQMAMESNSSVADRLATQQTLMGKVRSVEETLEEIEAVTAADIMRVSAEMLEPKRLRLGLITPEPDAAVATFEQLTQS